jgi:hypothetical protein
LGHGKILSIRFWVINQFTHIYNCSYEYLEECYVLYNEMLFVNY